MIKVYLDNDNGMVLIDGDMSPDSTWTELETPQGFRPEDFSYLILDQETKTLSIDENRKWIDLTVPIQKEYSDRIQAHLDSTAQSLGYDNIISAITYATDDDTLQYQLEGIAFRKWRSAVWIKVHELYSLYIELKEIPTFEDVLAELPVFTLPDQ